MPPPPRSCDVAPNNVCSSGVLGTSVVIPQPPLDPAPFSPAASACLLPLQECTQVCPASVFTSDNVTIVEVCAGHGTCDSARLGTGACSCTQSLTEGMWGTDDCSDCRHDYWGPGCLNPCPMSNDEVCCCAAPGPPAMCPSRALVLPQSLRGAPQLRWCRASTADVYRRDRFDVVAAQHKHGSGTALKRVPRNNRFCIEPQVLRGCARASALL